MQLQHYAAVIQRWLWLILLGTVICAGATYAVTKRKPPVYEASALIQVNDIGSVGNSGVYNDQALAVSYALLVTNNDVFAAASRELPGVSVSDLNSAVSAAPVDNTQIIAVRADAGTAQLAADMANTVATVFIQQQIAAASARDQTAAMKLSQELLTAKANVDNAQAQLAALQRTQAPQAQISREADLLDTYQVNYNALFSSFTQVQLQASLIDSSLTVSQSAIPPTAPKGLRASLYTALAAAMGLLLTVAFALLLDWLDTTIKTSEDVAHLAGLEPLGSVPLSRRLPNKSLENNPLLAQAFVTISTSFQVLAAGRKSILITGLHAGAGVSTTASWLAHALAQSGMRVLLIDANLGRPTQHTFFHMSQSPDVLTEFSQTDLLQAQQESRRAWLQQWSTQVANLYLLPAGSQLHSNETMRWAAHLRMLTEWLTSPTATLSAVPADRPIDIIIFDAPALDEGSETIALAPMTDGSLLVIDAGKERAEALTKAQATLQRLGSSVLGVVVNRQKATHRPYFYGEHPVEGAPVAENEIHPPLIQRAKSTN